MVDGEKNVEKKESYRKPELTMEGQLRDVTAATSD